MSRAPLFDRPHRRAGPAVLLAVFAVALLPGLIGLSMLLSPGGSLAAIVVFGIGAALAVTGMAASYPHDRLGGCNIVTMLRLAMASGLVAAIDGQGGGWAVFAVASVALALDGVDGYLARHQSLSSAFGARFDMEVDAILAAILALVVLTGGGVGPEVLVLGFLRYGFLAATVVVLWLGAPLDDSLRRKAICVIQIGVLAALTLPVLPSGIARGSAIIAAALLVWSFAVDIRTLARRR